MPAIPLPAAEPLQVCLVSGSLEYKSNESLADFPKVSRRPLRRAVYPPPFPARHRRRTPARLGKPRLLRRHAVVHPSLRLAGGQLDRIKRYCLAGKPVVGMRTASHAIQSCWNWTRKCWAATIRGTTPKARRLRSSSPPTAAPIRSLDGFVPYVSSGTLYKNPHIAADTQVLLEGRTTDPGQSVGRCRARLRPPVQRGPDFLHVAGASRRFSQRKLSPPVGEDRSVLVRRSHAASETLKSKVLSRR